jgi:hypothetical protein
VVEWFNLVRWKECWGVSKMGIHCPIGSGQVRDLSTLWDFLSSVQPIVQQV